MTEGNYQHHLALGTLLAEEYRIEKILGEGGFGVTYLATDLNIGRKFAIKEYMPGEMAVRTGNSTVVPKSQSEGENFQWGLERFLDEARTLATFSHPNLNQVNRFFKANGTAYMVLEFVEGETLSDRLKQQGALAETELVNLLKCLLSGLDVVHKAGYTHRDIKPGNIMIKPDGTPILLDFGAARQALGYKSKSITAILTPGYAPVEQYDTKADDIGPWTDIYSMGMVAYQCVSGCKSSELVEAVTRGNLLRKGQLENDLAPAVNVGQGRYSAELLQGIDWAIKIYEEQRPQDVLVWGEKIFSVEHVPACELQGAGSPETAKIQPSANLNIADRAPEVVVHPEKDNAKNQAEKIVPSEKKETSGVKLWVGLAVAFGCIALILVVWPQLSVEDQTNPKTTATTAPKLNDAAARQVEELQALLTKDAGNRSAWVRLGNVYFDSNRPQESVEAYVKALDLNPNDAAVLTDLSVMYRSLGQFDTAVESLEKALTIDKKYKTALYNLGIIYRYDLKDYDNAVKVWEKFVQYYPNAQNAEQIRADIENMKLK